jgi:hypothetical protein
MSEVTSRVRLDSDGTTLTVERVQDVEAIIERNKLLRTLPQRSDWGRHIATIPNIIIERWMKEDGVNVLGLSSEEFGEFIRKKLNDPDWRHLRTDR